MQPEDFFFRHRTENIFFGGAILCSIETIINHIEGSPEHKSRA
jgi:hypothetical protein